MSKRNRPRSLRHQLQTSSTDMCRQVILCILPIAQCVVGAVFHNDCPRQPYIPIYLLVAGVFSLLLGLLDVRANHGEAWSCLLSVFFCCWFIAGSVWIYSIYEPNYNKTTTSTDPYCDRTLYLFAFWTTNVTYFLLGLTLFSSCML